MNLNEGTENVPRLGFNRLRYLQQFYDSFTRLQFGIFVSDLSVLEQSNPFPTLRWCLVGWVEGRTVVCGAQCLHRLFLVAHEDLTKQRYGCLGPARHSKIDAGHTRLHRE